MNLLADYCNVGGENRRDSEPQRRAEKLFPAALLCGSVALWFFILIHFGCMYDPLNLLSNPDLLNAGDRVRRRQPRPQRLLLPGPLPPFPRHELKTIFVMGCTSQITGIRLFKLFGPGLDPFACLISKNNDPSISTDSGG